MTIEDFKFEIEDIINHNKPIDTLEAIYNKMQLHFLNKGAEIEAESQEEYRRNTNQTEIYCDPEGKEQKHLIIVRPVNVFNIKQDLYMIIQIMGTLVEPIQVSYNQERKLWIIEKYIGNEWKQVVAIEG